MAGSSILAENKKKARIEIIPLIDVIFFLLATFVLFTLSLARIAALPVQLPVASSDTTSKPDDDMVKLQVSDAGTCFWNQEPITVAEIRPRLQHYKTETQNPRVLISGDSKAKFGLAVLALDEVRKAGISQVSVDTRPPSGR
jgi:biopolymer transport protein ExbD